MCKECHQDISPLVWLIFPIVSYLFLYGVILTGFPSPVARLLGSEQGVIENAQVIFLLLFIGFGSKILWRKTPLPHPRLRLWIMLLIAGGLYTLVEEISWGQHYFGWITPPWIADLNSQDQTNLHNVDGEIFYQIPRVLVMYLPYNLLLIAIYGGGLVYPLWTRGQRPSWYWPTYVGIVWAALTACASLPLTIAEWLDHPLSARHGELQEYFLYGFLLIYLYSLHYRLRANPREYSQTTA
jgi:hypothetical protein